MGTYAGIEAFAQNCPSLKVTNVGIESGKATVVASRPWPRTARHYECSVEQMRQALSSNCPSVTNVVLSSCGMVTDVSVEAVAKNFTSLTTIYLDRCGKVTDAGIEA